MEVRIITMDKRGNREVSLRYSKYALKQFLKRVRSLPHIAEIIVYNIEGRTDDGQRIHQEYCNVGD